ncbi:MAG: hypothetical protein CMC96_00165 [Flavobacteriales bacterium]|nr:hypothetical protein [Flavobacteriales bacterium]|tara:strand:+ start:33944 stop:34945 length:1002 start_codon:yes stop_codon:yes gene_type:complete
MNTIKITMKKQFILILSTLFVTTTVSAQTVEQYTMWNQNHFLVNPAAAGNQSFFDVSTGFRKQWSGIKEAPQTFYATGHVLLNRPKTFERSALRTSQTMGDENYNKRNPNGEVKHALGAKMGKNEFGAFGKVEAMLTYAIHLPINKDLTLAFGLSAGLNSFSFNEDRAKVLDENDPLYNAYVGGDVSNKLNANSGVYLYSKKFFFGYAANQLLQNELELADQRTNTDEASLKLTHQVLGGYHFDLNNDFRLTPSVLLKKVDPSPISFDVNALLTYREFLYMGASYRSTDAVSAMFGIQVNHYLNAGYAYDFLTSDLNKRSGGSHEIFIGLTLY